MFNSKPNLVKWELGSENRLISNIKFFTQLQFTEMEKVKK